MLNKRQTDFLTSYLKSGNATSAAVAAGYSARTAYSQGQRLLKNVELSAAVSDYQNVKLESVGLTTTRIIKELASLCYSDIRKVIDKDPEQWDDFTAVAVSEYSKIIKPDGTVNIRVKMHSKQTALDMAMKHLGMFVSETDLLNRMTDEQLDFLIVKLNERMAAKEESAKIKVA